MVSGRASVVPGSGSPSRLRTSPGVREGLRGRVGRRGARRRLILNRRLALGLLLSGALSACGEPPALTVGEVGFLERDLLGRSDAQIEELTRITAVGIAVARDEGARLAAQAVERAIDDARIDRLREEAALDRAGIEEAHLRAQYGTNPEEELVVRHLVILSERWRSTEHRAEARARAESALARARAGEPFPELAGAVSEEPGAAERGGLLAPGREGTWVREFWDAARALEVGGISPVVESEYGFHVLRLEERSPVPFEEARPRVAARVAAGVDDRQGWEDQVDAWIATADPPVSVEGGGVSGEDRRAVLLAEANRRGLRLAEPDEARITREWEQRIARWGEVFGFRPGMEPGEISAQALEALGRSNQEARLARQALAQASGELEGVYPVERPGN
jgi:hypothetical protein